MTYQASLSYAVSQDQQDSLNIFREQFHFPQHNGKDAIYLCGNSLGLQPKALKAAIQQELDDWQTHAVEGYWRAENPWLYYQQFCRNPMAPLIGAQEQEVSIMNTLTTNLHLLMLSFYRPAGQRYKIIMEAGAFPSDQYAVETQVKLYGYDPADAIIEVAPRPGEHLIRLEDILQTISEQSDSLALLLFGGINYYTGQLFDIKALTDATHKAGAFAGFDLAHAVGNVPLQLHDWKVDFAVWCSYKYLNGGPGAVGGAFIHAQHAAKLDYPRAGGWWGNDESTRFLMEKGFVPKASAEGWQLSTAQVFNMVGLKTSLQLFGATTITALSAKSLHLTGYLEYLLQQLKGIPFEILTPKNCAERGAQLSLFFGNQGKAIHQQLTKAGIIADFREPGVIRLAPAPIYNTYQDVFHVYEIISNIQTF
ncbi:Kynureninase [Chitinophaga costaii]|uniref:Kynureninase n=1 Tax=Chitinophaga costaii TaxID=1335309 RepID=A0A1C4F8P0_9BACT|nr:kynureninase [Chitinophaga costaii]PUZ21190.1 kynureninase [Chitinophaga costaii]SCC52194.1 Kynureninase [Chitinophaga costaii]